MFTYSVRYMILIQLREKRKEGDLVMLGSSSMASGSSGKEAEVECKSCHRRKWVGWDKRHDGMTATSVDYSLVRCRDCAPGKDFTVYTGRWRFKS